MNLQALLNFLTIFAVIAAVVYSQNFFPQINEVWLIVFAVLAAVIILINLLVGR